MSKIKLGALSILILALIATVSCATSSVDYLVECEICGEQKATESDVYSDRYIGYICSDCMGEKLNEFTICHNCGEYSDYDERGGECAYGYCYDCTKLLTSPCSICESGPYPIEAMESVESTEEPGHFYVCAACVSQFYDKSSDRAFRDFVTEESVFTPVE